MRQTRARNIRIRITDPLLTHIEKYAKISGMDIEDYLIGCGTEFPQLIGQLETIRQEKGRQITDSLPHNNDGGSDHATGGTLQTGTEEIAGEASV